MTERNEDFDELFAGLSFEPENRPTPQDEQEQFDDLIQNLNHDLPAFDLESDRSFEENLLDVLDTKKSSFSTPSDFRFDVSLSIEQAVSSILQDVHPDLLSEHLLTEHTDKLTFLYQHYGFFQTTLAEIIKKKQPDSRYFDIAKVLLSVYQDYVLEKLPFLPSEVAPFGRTEQWMDLCESLHDLYRGVPDAYIRHMITLTK